MVFGFKVLNKLKKIQLFLVRLSNFNDRSNIFFITNKNKIHVWVFFDDWRQQSLSLD